MNKLPPDWRKSDGASYNEWRDAIEACHPLALIVPEWTWRRAYEDDLTPWEAAAEQT